MTQSGHVLRANDDHLASSLVIFSFLIAAPLVFFLPVADNFVDFLALAGVLRVVRRRFDLARHEAVHALGP